MNRRDYIIGSLLTLSGSIYTLKKSSMDTLAFDYDLNSAEEVFDYIEEPTIYILFDNFEIYTEGINEESLTLKIDAGIGDVESADLINGVFQYTYSDTLSKNKEKHEISENINNNPPEITSDESLKTEIQNQYDETGGDFNITLRVVIESNGVEVVSDKETINMSIGPKEYDVEPFTEVGSHTYDASDISIVDVLVVAGGGGGGGDQGGGGGSGGVILYEDYDISDKSSIPIEVGDGGLGDDGANLEGEKGDNSRFGELEAIGGGGGSGHDADRQGNDGGSGGGAAGGSGESNTGGESIQEDNSDYTSFGNDGGGGHSDNGGGHGGGGATERGGQSGSGNNGGNGGDGIDVSNIFGTAFGEDGWFAGGGGGGANQIGESGRGIGGKGGGADGGWGDEDNPEFGSSSWGEPAIENTGGGGGGGDGKSGAGGGKGGSGIVLVLRKL